MHNAACAPSLHFGAAETIDIRSLASYPLLLLEPGYSVRVQFNAACRLANVKPNILFESRAPHTLLALAEARHGVAIIPSLLRTDRYKLTILSVVHRGKPLREGLVVQWDDRRPILPYAANFREALAEHMREVFSMTQPSKGKSALARKQVGVARARGQ
jgi:DNA-binding transcriptional LysR family regulator